MKSRHYQRRVILRYLHDNGGRAWVADRDTAESLERRGLITILDVNPEQGAHMELTDAGRAET